MTQETRARAFAALHQGEKPLILYNAWDAGSARAVAAAGAAAIATSSWAVAAAQGYEDGEAAPFDLVLAVAGRVAASVDPPVTVDIEGGYAQGADGVAANVARLIEAGVVGINLEDRAIGGGGLREIGDQSARIAAARLAADERGVALFINARTDVFFGGRGEAAHKDLIPEAAERAAAYREAGASGLFAPGLVDPALIGALCEATDLPVNVMMSKTTPAVATLATLGVRRISYGPAPYIDAMDRLTAAAKAAFETI